MPAIACQHADVSCLNEYELIRKYRCGSCNQVMMCSCDERRGQRFLPHQLHEGVDYLTKQRVSVTLGFQASVCRECRGLHLSPCPRQPFTVTPARPNASIGAS